MTDRTTDQPEPGEFAAFLVQHLGGSAHEQISTDMHQLLAAVAEHGKKGELVIKISVETPKAHIDGGPLAIAVTSTLKAPAATVPPAIYFVDAAGNPTRDDPRQLALEFRTAPATTTFKDA